ncbi:alpha/beta hydrolase [Rossellomorea aquimaris]|uniref:alpha/beta hydrolase n=1 Tax=Rossellomorea aquimaris TaxID=189382 RepID=UPI0007D083A1|nr:alpha/beta hydrolase [Rossellomorea aquimaris]
MGLFFKKKDFIIPSTGIDTVEKINLGGVEQSILIQAVDPSNPVLLFIHGGPCMPVPGVVSRGQDYAIATNTKKLVEHFVLVFWDQRGAGKSYSHTIPPQTIRVEQFISDGNELIGILKEKFTKEKIYLAAHSWGSMIGLSIASRYPEQLHAYIGISQLLSWTENDTHCYDWVKNKAEKSNDTKTLRKLEQIGKPPYVKNVKQWTSFRTILMKYKSMIYENETVKHPGMLGGLKLFLNSSDYTLKDIFNTFYRAYQLTYTQTLINDFANVNLNLIKKIEVPLYFLHGTHDFHVDGKPVKRFLEEVETTLDKEMYWFENSSHMFHPVDTQEIEDFLIKLGSSNNDSKSAVI